MVGPGRSCHAHFRCGAVGELAGHVARLRADVLFFCRADPGSRARPPGPARERGEARSVGPAMTPGSRRDDVLAAGRIVVTYAVFAAAWIFLSDRAVAALGTDPELLVRVEMAKGILFIVVTALLLHALILDHTRRLRRAADDLAANQRLTSALLEGTPDAVFVKDRDGRYLLANSATASFVGKPAGDVLGCDDRALFAAADAEAIMAVDRAVLESGEVRTVEERVVIADGTSRTFLSTKGPLLDADGVATGIFGITRDITTRTEGERALERSEARYRSLFVSLMSGVAHVRVHFEGDAAVDLEYLDVNPAFGDVTGIDAPVVGRRMSELVPGYCAGNPDALATFGRVATTGASERWEHRVAELDRWFSLMAYSPARGEVVIIAENISDRKRAEVDLTQSEARLRTIVDGAPDAIFTQVGGRFAYLNPAACRLFGVGRAAELVGSLVLDRVAPEHYERARSRIERLNEERVAVRDMAEITFLRADGSEVAAETTGEPITFEGRDGALVFVRDATARRQAEAALRESLRFNQQVIESAGTGIIVYDRDLRYRVWNPFMERLTGVAAADVLGKRALEVFPFLAAVGVVKDVEDTLQGSPSVARELPYERPGRVLWCSDANAPLRDTKGEIIGVIGMVHDITERRQAADEARRQAGMIRSLLDAIPDLVFYKDASGTYVDCNPAFAEFIGRPRADIVGKTDHDLVAKDLADFFREQDRRMSESRRPRRNEEWVDYPDGRKVLLDTLKTPYVGASADAVGVLGISRDVTERSRTEAEKDALRAQLQQAQRMESIGRLAGGVAHDFNNILQAQKGYCELMALELRAGDPLAESLAEIDACVDRATALTRQLLAFSRKQVLRPQVFDLGELVVNLEKMLRRLIGEDVALTVVADGGPFTIEADPGQIEQLVVNVVVNARDAMPTGGQLRVTLGTDVRDAGREGAAAPSAHVTLAIGDTGAGMDDETRAHIFEPFFTTKPAGKGTGLGLSTVYGIVQQSGGSIDVESEVGRGTTFTIRLPRVAGAAPTHRVPASGLPRGHGEHVLVVDDDPALARITSQLIGRLGYRPEVVTDPRAAVALVEEQGLRPDLLVTDVVMPGMGGRVMVERLRRTLPALKVMYMSGYTDDATLHHGVSVDGVAFLQKPFSLADLARKVREALERPA